MTEGNANAVGRSSSGGVDVSQKLQDMYEGYYEGRNIKREITAEQTIEHIRSVWIGGRVDRMLDVGAGEGSLLTQLAKSGLAKELYAVEISGTGVDAIAARNVSGLTEVKKFDGYHIPYDDKYFDVACSIHVLEHVEHERIFLKELARVAKHLIIEVPLEHTMRVQRSIGLTRKYGHINLYAMATFRNLLETTALDVDAIKLLSNSLPYEKCVFGPVLGAIKFAIRSGLGRIAPAIAASSMTYMCIASCTPRSDALPAA